MIEDEVTKAFAPVLGMPTWQVKQGYGSFVTFEFGEPTLEVHYKLSKVSIDTKEGKLELPRRLSVVHGEWHLWIYCCNWTLTHGDHELAHSESDTPTIAKALLVLNGQALTNVEVEKSDARSVFDFDLGCRLTTTPFEREEEPTEQWSFSYCDGQSLAFFDDGTFTSEPFRS